MMARKTCYAMKLDFISKFLINTENLNVPAMDSAKFSLKSIENRADQDIFYELTLQTYLF